MALTLPDPSQLATLQDRALCGRDLLFLRQWTGLNIADCCYLLGMPVVRWKHYQNRPDDPIDDAGVALLARALLVHPEAHFLPRFPEFNEMEPALRRALRQSARPLPGPDTALGLLLGRDRASVGRWRRGTGPRKVPPPVRRLLLVLGAVLADHGVQGFESLVDRAALEAAARGFDLESPAMVTWARRAPYRRRPGSAPRGRPPKPKPPASPAPDAAPPPPWLPPPRTAEREVSPAPLPDAPSSAAPMTGRDVAALQGRLRISRADLCYLLGHPLDSGAWGDDAPPGRPLPDPAVALLVWALTRFPDIRYLPAFPGPAEVFARYRALVAPLGAAAPVRPPADGLRAFGLLLGRSIKAAPRWLATGRPEPLTPLASRLLGAVDALLAARGAAGLDAWIARATLEAAARGVDLRAATCWTRPTDPVTDPVTDPAGGESGQPLDPREPDARPALWRDAADLCRALGLPVADGAYLLGLSPPTLRECLDRPDRTVGDPMLALLVWLLLTFPETRFLAPFPAPAAVYPAFLEAAATAAGARPLLERCPSGPAAFGVLLGRSGARALRWLAPAAQPAQPPVARLALALSRVLERHGAAGLDAWVDQVRVEADARRRDPAATASWERAGAPEPGLDPRDSPDDASPTRGRGRPRKRPPDASGPPD